MIGKSILVFNSILFYFDIPMPMITTLSDAHSIDMRHYDTWMICELPLDMIGYCMADVVLCLSHLIYEIHHHYSPLDMTMYTYVH